MGGTNDEENLIDLFAQEHFIAHRLLAEENPDNEKLVYAWWCMFSLPGASKKRIEITSEEYEEIRIKFSNMLKEKYKNKENHPCYGIHLSEERKRKIGETNKGNKYCLGRIITDETKKKIGDANRNPREETRKKMSEARKGKKTGASNSNAKSGIRLSDEKIYGCAKDAAPDNNINYSTFKAWLKKGNKNFMYYEKWLQQNNLENNIC